MVPAGTTSSGGALIAPGGGGMAINCSPGAAAPGGSGAAGTGIGNAGPGGGTAPAFAGAGRPGTSTFGCGSAGATMTGAALVVELWAGSVGAALVFAANARCKAVCTWLLVSAVESEGNGANFAS